jgi:cell division protein FtsL
VNRARRAVWPFLVSVAVVGVLFLLVFPARTYLAQRRSLAAAETRVKVLTTENKSLDQRVSTLQQPAEIERLAREQYGMVKPGEEAYAILPSPTPPPPATPPKPPVPHRNVVQRLWHAVF